MLTLPGVLTLGKGRGLVKQTSLKWLFSGLVQHRPCGVRVADRGLLVQTEDLGKVERVGAMGHEVRRQRLRPGQPGAAGRILQDPPFEVRQDEQSARRWVARAGSVRSLAGAL